MTIVAYGGLWDSFFQWLGRGLLNPIKQQRFPSVVVHYRAWTSGKIIVSNTVVIGHSFGVRAAVEQCDSTTKLLLLIDPRMPPWGSGGVVAPKGVRTVCIYQRGFMRGYPVEGAMNYDVTGDGYGHTALPWHPKVHEILESVL